MYGMHAAKLIVLTAFWSGLCTVAAKHQSAALSVHTNVGNGEDDSMLSQEQLQQLERIRSGDIEKRDVEIVVASCRDDLSWLRWEYKRLTTNNDQCTLTSTLMGRNVGRESHVYLQHIVDHYDDLAEWTVFTQGHDPSPGYDVGTDQDTEGGHMLQHSLFDDYVLAGGIGDPLYMPATSAVQLNDPTNYRHSVRSAFLIDAIVPSTRGTWGVPVCPTNTEGDVFTDWFDMKLQPATETEYTFERLFNALEFEQLHLSTAQERNPAVAQGIQEPPSAKQYFTKMIGKEPPTSDILVFSQGARFGVSAASIRSKPKAFYTRLLKEVSHANDPYQGYYNEWMWPWIVSDGHICEEPSRALKSAPSTSARGRRLASSGSSSNSRGGNTVIIISGVGGGGFCLCCCCICYFLMIKQDEGGSSVRPAQDDESDGEFISSGNNDRMTKEGSTMKIYNAESGDCVGGVVNARAPEFVGKFPWGEITMKFDGNNWVEAQDGGPTWVRS